MSEQELLSARKHTGHPVRAAILEFLEANPGTSLKALCEGTNGNRGTTTHHVRILENIGLVISIHTGWERLLFLRASLDGVDEPEKLCVLLCGRAMELAEAIVAKPGSTQNDLLDETNVSRSTLCAHMDKFIGHDLVEATPGRRPKRYSPTPLLIQNLRHVRGIR